MFPKKEISDQKVPRAMENAKLIFFWGGDLFS
jgi:hypothetical protein